MAVSTLHQAITPTSPTITDPELKGQSAQFFQQGYLILRDVFQDDELHQLREQARWVKQTAQQGQFSGMRFWKAPKGSCSRKDIPSQDNANNYSWGVNEITRPELFQTALIEALAHPKIDPVLNALLDRPRAWGLKLLWASQSSHYNLGWHRDLWHGYDALMPWKPAANDHIQFNAALEPDASFIVIPGSHRRSMLTKEKTLLAQSRTAHLPNQVRVTLNPGDLVIMDAHSLHRGEAPAGAPRLSLHYSCQASWVPLRPWGSTEEFTWLCSEAFRSQLSPPARVYYDRLLEAPQLASDDAYAYLEHVARQQGFTGVIPPSPDKKKNEKMKP